MAHDRKPSGDLPYRTNSYPQDTYQQSYPDSRNYQSSYTNVNAPPSHHPEFPLKRPGLSPVSSSSRLDGRRPPEQPIYNAVNSAFDNSAAVNQLPSDVIQQITEQVRSQVIDSLKAEGLAGPVPTASAPLRTQQTFAPPPLQPFASSVPASNFTSRPKSPSTTSTSRTLHTPPSPARRSSDGSNSDGDYRDKHHMPDNGGKEDLSARYGDRSQDDTNRRPSPVRMQSHEEETVVEKMWQPLFDKSGEPVPRVGQFLRGLALHLIDDYEPKKSLVISPLKLKSFYEDVKLQDETYPWPSIFRLSNGAIGKIYRDLKVQYFLVQDDISQSPHIPSLTPVGFQRWMTLMIQAHPQAEFERLAIAVRDMPISNADDPKERFPKELSRRLFPKYDNMQVRQLCGAALSADGQIHVPRHTSFPPPPPSQPPNGYGDRGFTERSSFADRAQAPPHARVDSPSPSSGHFTERERAPYGNQSSQESGSLPKSSAAFARDDDDYERRSSMSIPIERERKPYTAKAGSGKVYEDERNAQSARTVRQDAPSNPSRNRARSNVGDRNSTYTEPSAGARPNARRHSIRRPRSPTSNPYVRSEGSSVSDVPSNHYNSNMYGDLDEERYGREADRHRDRGSDRERDVRERDTRDREPRDREPRDRENSEREEWGRSKAAEEGERRHSRYDGEPLSKRSTADSTYYPPPPLGAGERRYG